MPEKGWFMAVDFDRFVEWAESRFDDVIVKGGEVRLNSIFSDEPDAHFHLWCSPSGGKKQRENGVFHCFKTDRKGSLVTLVMEVDKCDYDDALATLRGETSLRVLEQKLEEFFNQQEAAPKAEVKLYLPPHSSLISANPNGWWERQAREYLKKRAIPPDDFYICTDGQYKGRIIIPYYDRNGKLIYWNARATYPKAKLRYVGPPKEVGVGKEDVVYMDHWPPAMATVHLCEGEFNAKSLSLAGLHGAACGGKSMSEKQAVILTDYRVVICLDRDKPGWKGAASMSEKLSAISVRLDLHDRLLLVRPPVGFKDWNEMLVKFGPEILAAYVERSAKPLEQHTPLGKSNLFFDLRDV